MAASAKASARVGALLSMNQAESSRASVGVGSDFVIARLMDLTLVEVLRTLNPSVKAGRLVCWRG